VREHARRANAAIHAVLLFDRDDAEARPGVLKRLARETGGEAFTPRDVDDVVAAFEQIAREIRSGYTIGFSPPDVPDEGFRTVRVAAVAGDGRALIVRTRAGYYAGRSGSVVR
jgi:VWFA-related protein